MKGGLQYNETKFINSKVKKLGELITNSNNLEIPHHQRDYSWEEEEIEEFLNDVERIMTQEFDDIDAMPHFLGSFVFIENEDRKVYEVVDGQQRIVTTMLYFNAIRLLAKKYLEGEQFSTILIRTQEYIYKSKAGQYPIQIRVKLGRAGGLFNKLLLADDFQKIDTIFNSLSKKRDVDNRLYTAFKIIYSHLETKIKEVETKFERLLKYVEAVQTMMVAIEIIVQQPGIAYIIFETLNARGKELSAANLIKNEVLKEAEKEGNFNKALNVWSSMLEEITQYEKANVTDFLINSYWSNFKYIPQATLFQEIKELLKTLKVSDYVQTIENDYLNYLKIASFDKNIDSKFSKKVILYLEELNKFLNIKRVYPLLLSGAYKLNNDEFEELVIKTVNFAFRFKTIMGKTADSLLKMISELAIKLRQEKITPFEIYETFKKEAKDDEFKLSFSQFRPGTNKLGFYIIKKIEDYLAQGQGIEVIGQSISQHLEHILPKKIKKENWPHLFADDKLDERSDLYINKIGNLTILEKDINSYIKNKSFDFKNRNSKQKDYQHSLLKLPKQIENFLTNNRWEFSSIDKRGEYLAELAVKVWPV